ncbi:MAG: metallophosphoesterase [Treponema sp.]|nr:metallophosphoesterase [Treponema sp.]
MSVVIMIIVLLIILSIFGGANYYIAKRLYQMFNYFLPNINTKLYIGIYLSIAVIIIFCFIHNIIPFPYAVKRILNWINAHWMGFIMYLLLIFIAVDLLLLLGSIVKIITRPMPLNIRFYANLFAIIMTIGLTGYGLYNANQIKHVSYEINIKDTSLNNFNIVMISDSHLGAVNNFESNLEKIVKEINSLNPDIVCLTGDIFNDNFYAIRDPKSAVSKLKSINSRYGVYAVLGNHDGGKTINLMINFLEESNIRLLKDEYVIIDDRLILIGRLDPRPIGGAGDLKRGYIDDILNLIKSDNNTSYKELPIVVMEHSPSNINQYDERISLILAGHTHRGQMFPGSLLTRAMFTVDYGHYQKDKNSPHVIVTSGISTWGPPMRLGTQNEIVNVKIVTSVE